MIKQTRSDQTRFIDQLNDKPPVTVTSAARRCHRVHNGMTLRSRHPPMLKLQTRQETLPLSSRAKSPGDDFAVSKKLAGLILRSVGGEPDDARGSFPN